MRRKEEDLLKYLKSGEGDLLDWAKSRRHEREIAATTAQLVEHLDTIKDPRSRAFYLEAHLREVVNAELDVIIALAYELELDAAEPELRAVIGRGSLDQCVVTAASLLKRQFAELCREHKREG